MKKMRKMAVMMLIGSVVLTGCSSGSSSDDATSEGVEASADGGGFMELKEADLEAVDVSDMKEIQEIQEYDMEGEADVTGEGLSEMIQSDRKLIKNVDLSVETREFDVFITNIRQKISDMEGYVQSSSISGNSYEYSDGMRYGYIVARIPAERMDTFVKHVEEKGNVTSTNENVQDVTESYVDTESRKKTLEASQESLLKLLESADSVEAVVALETRLTEIRSELESLEATLRSYDNLTAYSTIHLDISEVERIRETETETIGSEIKSRLSDNMYDIGQGARGLLIWFVSSLPYLLPLAAVAAAVFIIVRRYQKKKADRE